MPYENNSTEQCMEIGLCSLLLCECLYPKKFKMQYTGRKIVRRVLTDLSRESLIFIV